MHDTTQFPSHTKGIICSYDAVTTTHYDSQVIQRKSVDEEVEVYGEAELGQSNMHSTNNSDELMGRYRSGPSKIWARHEAIWRSRGVISIRSSESSRNESHVRTC